MPGQGGGAHRSGDAIQQEAHATRSRAFKRRNWERGGPAPVAPPQGAPPTEIALPGQTRAAIARLPVAALRLPPEVCTNLNRLDQALGAEPESISPAGAGHHFATRLSFPDPIGLQEDLSAGFDRLLEPLCKHLRKAGRGARKLRLTLFRTDQSLQLLEIGLARPSHEVDRIRPLMQLRLPDADAGFGIDVMRLEAFVTEPLAPTQHSGHENAVRQAQQLRDGDSALADLLGRIGARCGLESLICLHPADSHIPEKTATQMAAAYVENVTHWPKPPTPRPISLFAPDPVHPDAPGAPPAQFRWRRRVFQTLHASGPERIAPEWWLDDPNWRSGTRDYWQVETDVGERLWLFETRGSGGGGWFCHGNFG